MQNQSAQYRTLLEKLDEFTRKFYVNDLIRGSIFSAIYIILLFLAINVLEYYLYLPGYLRKILFFGFLGSSAFFLYNFVGKPLMHYYKLGKIISYEKAAEIIGKHFTEVKDKLLNILQLNKMTSTDQYDLLQAGINQKISDLKPIRFSNAVNLQENKKYLKYLIPPMLLFAVVIIAAPNIIKEGTKRLYNNDVYYEKQAPFSFKVKNKKMLALQNENFQLEVGIEGSALPAEVYLEANGQLYKLKKENQDLFIHEFVNVQEKTIFRLSANGFNSKEYTLDVLPKPSLVSFDVSVNYPDYIGKKDEVLDNIGDLSVPAGTRIRWTFEAKNTESLSFFIGDSMYTANRISENKFQFSKTAMQNFPYTLRVSNAEARFADSVSYSVAVTPDYYPTIQVSEKRDSLNDKYFYYIGEVGDDYGLKKLTFNYQIIRFGNENENSALKSEDVNITLPSSLSRFNYYWNIEQFGLGPGDKMNYYFEVFDNDGIHGSKSTRSNMSTFEMPTLNELEKEIDKENKELKDDLKESMKDAKKLKDQLRNMQDKVLDKKNVDWQDKKNIQDLADKQKDLQKQLEEIKDKMSKNFEKQDEFKDLSESVKEKQKKLQDLMDNMMNEEMKKLLEKLEKMLDQIQKKDAMNNMNEMEFNNEKLEKELDRMLELFKKLEFDQKMTETADKLEKLAEKQDSLNKEMENKGADNKELQKQQEELKKELQEAKKDLEDLKKMNEELKLEQDFKEAEQSLDNAEKQMEEAEQDMKQNKKDKASKNQKSASNNMKNASKKMKQMQMDMEAQQNSEDMQMLRQLLENILKLSFDQEKLMGQVKTTNINTPKYLELMQEQHRIKENSKMVEDSLYELAKRVFQIESFVTNEITNINKHLDRSLEALEERNVYKGSGEQQYVMTGYNNLALMLSESLQNMQQQQSESQSQCNNPSKSKSNCKKPGSAMPNMSQMQKQLNDKINQLGEMMKKEGQKGEQGNKPNDKEMAKRFAELAKQQAEIRKNLEKMNQQENKDGKKSLGDLGQAIEQMNKTETQLVNKQMTAEMMKRQQEILTRLLDAENAQRQRGEKEERESNTGKELERKMPPSLEEYLKTKQNETDFYKALPPSLKPFYKSLSEKYLKNVTLK